MQVPPTNDSEFSSLPTPSASQEPGWTTKPVNKNGEETSNPNERWYHPETGRLLQKGITQVFRENELLRTPAASEAERGHQPEEKAKARGGQVTLSGQTNFGGDFGRFEPAIRQWERITGVPAPEPTKPDGRDGNPRLSSEFTEWMMGLRPGWITGVGLSRKDELKACGNGVVPQQAMLALKMLKARFEVE
jgi:DNA (cytosine-5)-methyltransferase 1